MEQEKLTTITISQELWKWLNANKDLGERYEDVIWNLIKQKEVKEDDTKSS